MAENLIFGKSILDFGAFGDGKSDDTKAFVSAFESAELLITIPYGVYNINAPVTIKSGVKIHAHPKAVISHVGFVSAENGADIEICGGIWACSDKENSAFEFTSCGNMTISDCAISSESDTCVMVCNADGVIIEDVCFSSEKTASGIVFAGDVKNVTMCGIDVCDCVSAVEWIDGAVCDRISIFDLESTDCDYILKAEGSSISDLHASGIYGNAEVSAIDFSKTAAKNSKIRNIKVSDGYIKIAESDADMEISDFERLTDEEKNPAAYTLEISGCDTTMICDGASLDSIILAKKSIPDVKMVSAKLSHPLKNVYKYTFEAELTKKHNFIMPCGGFDSLKLILKKH